MRRGFDRPTSRRRPGRPGAWALASLLAALAAAAALWPLGGCGEKIVVPRAVGLFAVTQYYPDTLYTEQQPVQMAVVNTNLFVLDGTGALIKRGLKFAEIARVSGLAQPTALCADEEGQLVFVWEQGTRTIRVLHSSNLAGVSPDSVTEVLADVDTVAAMTASARGITAVTGAHTFLYLSDPHAGVIHRFAYTLGSGVISYGLLARGDGEGARSVHVPSGLAVDGDGMLLVCDADSNRNWVIRFDPTPSPGDVAPLWHGQQPLRGRAITFGDSTCSPASPADVTIGDAAACGQSDWVGGRSSAEGEFDGPRGLAVDGAGQIYVADGGNDRIQRFTPAGEYAMLFGTAEATPGPACLGCVDWRTGAQAEDVNFGAYLFVLTPGTSQVLKFISAEQYYYINHRPSP